ncbi:MAG TPA: nucleoside deaminase [Casimicrobiaceae bacterium]|nr:nucleoside deaminase [Casimicrobiaceae bacterium]
MNDAIKLRLRRSALLTALAASAWLASPQLRASSQRDEYRFFEAAERMRQLALASGDQPYGAVLVLDGAIVGEGPSRVVQRGDANAHAEREAIRDAQKRLGRDSMAGSILYSTSRPCPQCEKAAAEAGVARMIHGAALVDAGSPRR